MYCYCCELTVGGKHKISAKAVVIATGTFFRGEIHIGMESFPAGRMGEAASYALSDSLESVGFALARLKTGKLF